MLGAFRHRPSGHARPYDLNDGINENAEMIVGEPSAVVRPEPPFETLPNVVREARHGGHGQRFAAHLLEQLEQQTRYARSGSHRPMQRRVGMQQPHRGAVCCTAQRGQIVLIEVAAQMRRMKRHGLGSPA
jgi:hypothetical protein